MLPFFPHPIFKTVVFGVFKKYEETCLENLLLTNLLTAGKKNFYLMISAGFALMNA